MNIGDCKHTTSWDYLGWQNMTDIDEATVDTQARKITYDAFKELPGFQKYLKGNVVVPGSQEDKSNVKIDPTKAAPNANQIVGVPKTGDTKVVNGVTYVHDGKGWLKK
jgi:hypothetical protein